MMMLTFRAFIEEDLTSPKILVFRCKSLIPIAGIYKLLYTTREITYCHFDLIDDKNLFVLLGIDVHSLVGHPLTKLKLTLIFFPL